MGARHARCEPALIEMALWLIRRFSTLLNRYGNRAALTPPGWFELAPMMLLSKLPLESLK